MHKENLRKRERPRSGEPPARRTAKSRPADPRQAASVLAAPSGATERSLRLLEVLTEEAGPASLPAIAQAAGLGTNTAHRLLERLVAASYARKCATTKRYSIAARPLFPMNLYHPLNRLRLEAHEQLRLLRERHEESVWLITFVGLERIVIDFIPGRDPLNPLYLTRLGNPLYASAAGIVLLSGCSNEQRRRLLGEEPFSALTSYTATTYADLDKEFSALDDKGYAIVRQASFVGINAIAAPIRGPQGPIGCLVFSGSAHTMDESRLAKLGESLKHAATLISCGAPSIKAVADFLGHPAAELGT